MNALYNQSIFKMTPQELEEISARTNVNGFFGLTKLELFTAIALHGMLSNPKIVAPDSKVDGDVAEIAAKFAQNALDTIAKGGAY